MIAGYDAARELYGSVCYNMRAFKKVWWLSCPRVDSLTLSRRDDVKITDVKIEVVRRTLPDTGLDSDLGRFHGDVEQGVLRILTDEGVEGNCFVGDFREAGMVSSGRF